MISCRPRILSRTKPQRQDLSQHLLALFQGCMSCRRQLYGPQPFHFAVVPCRFPELLCFAGQEPPLQTGLATAGQV